MFKEMMKILGAYIIAATMIVTPIITNIVNEDVNVETIKPKPISVVEIVEETPMKMCAATPEEKSIRIIDQFEEVEITEPAEVEVVEEVVEELPLSNDEIELIALLTMAEAEGESDEGKRLVIDTVLNRVDSELSYFPDTVKGVIYQKNQFTSMWNGRVDRCHVSEEICELVKEELRDRTNSDVLWFRADYYGQYGVPLLVEGNHYFSKHA